MLANIELREDKAMQHLNEADWNLISPATASYTDINVSPGNANADGQGLRSRPQGYDLIFEG